MSVAAIRPALLLLLALLAPPALSLALQGNLAQPVSIAGEWRVQAGDQLDWAAPEFDDSAWSLTQVPAYSPENLRGYAGLI